MSRTATQLIRELSNRLGELAVITATSDGLATTIISTGLNLYMPAQVTNFHPWVYAYSGTASNVGQERRATSWTPSTNTLTLLSPGFSAATATSDVFELHMRSSRTRKLEALNDAVGQLGLLWYRQVIDTSLTTAQNTWRYTLPSDAHFAKIEKIELQVNTAESDYAYADAKYLNWSVQESEASDGTLTQIIQFEQQPTPNRTLRVFGEAYFPDLSADDDVLALSGKWERAALSWIFDWSKYRLLEEATEQQPGGQADRYRQRALDKLQTAKQQVLDLTRSHTPGRIIVPGVGDGQLRPMSPNWRYLGAFRSGGLD